MKYKKSLLDSFLEQWINDNAKELKHTLNETLEMEQNCLEQIRQSISHCKDNIAACEKQIKKCSPASLAILETKKSAFKDNLLIWNTMGHIQMASIEMKEYLKRLSVDGIDEWEQRDVIKSVYKAIYETSKKLVDATAGIFKFIKRCFPNYDYRIFTNVRKELTKFRESNASELTRVRNMIDAHRDVEVSVQMEVIEGLHLANAVQLIVEYEDIINKLGNVTSPIKELGLKRLQACF